jgi:hypothetical protein
VNIGDLYAQTLAISSAAADLILVSPDKYTGFTPSEQGRFSRGFVFQIVGDESINLQSDITDHYVEDNTAKQDHVALRPKTVTVSGFIGELNNVVPDLLEIPKEALDRLGVLDAYIPSITNTARRAFNIATQLYGLSQKIKNSISVGLKIPVRTKQEAAFSELAQYHALRTTFYIATPFGQFSDMIIQSITATQNQDTKSLSDFSVTFKELRTTGTKLSGVPTSPRVSFGEPVVRGDI